MPRIPAFDEDQQAAIGHTPVTEKQESYIRDLMAKHDWETLIPGVNSRPLRLPDPLAREDASAVIDWLRRRPLKTVQRTAPQRRAQELEKGGWLDEATGVMYFIDQTKDKRGWNVKFYNPATEKLEYIGGSLTLPVTARKATLDEMASAARDLVEAGHEAVFCYACGRRLSNPLSMQLGIGPWCRGDRG